MCLQKPKYLVDLYRFDTETKWEKPKKKDTIRLIVANINLSAVKCWPLRGTGWAHSCRGGMISDGVVVFVVWDTINVHNTCLELNYNSHLRVVAHDQIGLD